MHLRCKQSRRTLVVQSQIVRTLAYADCFDYPLKEDEIYRWLITSSDYPLKSFKKSLKSLIRSGKVKILDGYFFLPGRTKIINFRLQREKISREKLSVAQKSIGKLKNLPFIKFIGLTGALAMNNAAKNDDIDLMIITRQNSLWLTRLLIVLFSPLLGIKRRKPKDRLVKDKICFNLFLDESDLKINPENLFVAHEVCQVRPLVNNKHAYEKFLKENGWVKRYLPNALGNLTIQHLNFNNEKFLAKLLNYLIAVLNRVFFVIQYQYMKSKITSEKISLTRAFFHPGNLGEKILEKYQTKLASLGLKD